MIKTKYTKGFEIFWKVWSRITNKKTDKPEAFKYWKRDKLEGDENELIRRLNLQQAERRRFEVKGEWIPAWCFCRKWLNRRRYEYVPEPPKTREIKVEPLTPEEIKAREEMNTPAARVAKAKYEKLRDELFGKDGRKILKPLSQSEIDNRRNKQKDKLGVK